MGMVRRVLWRVGIITVLAMAAHFGLARAQDACAARTDYVVLGQSSYASGDYAAAFDAFTCAIQLDSTDYDAYLGRFQAAVLSGHYSMAVNDANIVKDFAPGLFDTTLANYNLTLSLDGSDVPTYMQRALIYWTMAEDQLVLADAERIIQLDSQNALAYLLRGSSNQYLGDRLTPPADFTQASLLEPDNPDIYALIGSTYVQTGDDADASMNLERALALDPSHARSYYFRGLLAMGELHYDRAIADFTRAIEVDPQYLEPYYDRGLTYVRQGNFPAAIGDFDRVIALNASFDLGYLSRGGVYDLMGDQQAAARDYMAYVRLHGAEQIAGQALTPGVPLTLEMTDGRVYVLSLAAQMGQTVDITASSPQDRADPLIVLLSADGAAALAGSDDDVVGDYTAAIHDFSIPATGTYTLLVTHSDGGYQGTIDVTAAVQ
jgi:tetratricopeptide (TPR) repeat protein